MVVEILAFDESQIDKFLAVGAGKVVLTDIGQRLCEGFRLDGPIVGREREFVFGLRAIVPKLEAGQFERLSIDLERPRRRRLLEVVAKERIEVDDLIVVFQIDLRALRIEEIGDAMGNQAQRD